MGCGSIWPRWATIPSSARPLKRVIQREVQGPLAMAILRSEFREGDTIRVDYRDGKVVFAK